MDNHKKTEEENVSSATGGATSANSTEQGKLTEKRDDIPHGHGAHVNEKEANAQEDYPGVEESQANKE